MGRADHTKFNNMVKNLQEAWDDLDLPSYKLVYEKYGQRIRLICPDGFATQTDKDSHRYRHGVYRILWQYWRMLNEYIRGCTASQQRYLARKHGMVKVR